MSVDAPEPKLFDLKAALSGRTFATETVTIFLDEDAMYNYARISQASDLDPASKEKAAERDKLLKFLQAIAIKVTVRSVPQDQEETIVQELVEKYPPRYSAIGSELPDREANAELNAKLWQLHIVKIEAPDGSFIVPNEHDIRALRDSAPRVALETIARAINELNTKVRSGYDTAVQDPDFLSQPSPTE